MQLITDEYRKLNEEKHAASINYGTCGSFYADDVLKLCAKLNTKDILDYGCGKSTLAHNIPFPIKQYDPCVDKYKEDPAPADVVVCTDVMEHIEPECLDNVIKHLHSKVKKILYCSICTVPAMKHLPDGRNVHLITEGLPFWINKLDPYFNIYSVTKDNKGMDFLVVAEARDLEKENDKPA